MKELNAVTSTRLRVLGVILGIIVLIHVIVILCVMRPGGQPSGAASDVESAVPQGAAKPVAAGTTAAKPVVPARSAGRYYKPVTAAWFGKPFIFSSAVRGNLPQMPYGKNARSGILVDLTTRQVLWCKDERKAVPVASMAKMMTILLAFEEMERRPELSLDTPVRISRSVAKVPRDGIMWLDARETFPFRHLLMGAMIRSANDAAYQVAETVSGGNVDAFVTMMNNRAASLEMPGTRFINPHGLPSRDHRHSVSSALGMVILGERLLEYPDAMKWASTQYTSIPRPGAKERKCDFSNTNRLVNPRYPGVDGLKTGYTRAAKSCLTFTAVRNGRRLMGCVTGFPSARERDVFSRRMLDWGYMRAAEIAAGKTAPPAPGKVIPLRKPKRK